MTASLAESQSAEERSSKSAETLTQRDRQLNALTGQLAQLPSANDQSAQSDQNAIARIDELSAQLSQLEADKQALGEQLRLEQEKASNALATVSDRDHQIQSLQGALDDQKTQLDQKLNVQSNALTKLKTEFSTALSSQQQDRSQLQQLKNDLKQQKERHDSDLADLKGSHRQELLDQRRKSDSSFHSTRIELKQYQRLLSESEKRGAEWKQRVNALEQNQAPLEAQLKQAQAELQRASDAHREKVDSLEKAAEQAKLLQARERSELEKQLQEKQLQVNQEAQATFVPEQESAFPKEPSEKTATPRKPSKAKEKVTASAKRKSNNDDLTLISGIGPVAAKKLSKLKVESFEQISQWTAEDVKRFSDALSVGSRIKNEKWVKQAKKQAR